MKFTRGLKHRNNTYLSKFVVNKGNVELVLKKENDTKQVALAQDQSQNDTKKQDDKGQKKA